MCLHIESSNFCLYIFVPYRWLIAMIALCIGTSCCTSVLYQLYTFIKYTCSFWEFNLTKWLLFQICTRTIELLIYKNWSNYYISWYRNEIFWNSYQFWVTFLIKVYFVANIFEINNFSSKLLIFYLISSWINDKKCYIYWGVGPAGCTVRSWRSSVVDARIWVRSGHRNGARCARRT